MVTALAGCGGGSAARTARPRPVSLVLDFTPNAVHAGIYSALARGYDRDAGIGLHVFAPSSSTDGTKLLLSGRADLALLDIHDLAIARERGRDLVGVMALVERPLAAVLAQPGIRTPRDLEGEDVGVTGVPSDEAVLRSVVAGAGGDPAKVREVTIGFSAVPSLLAHKVAAATAFWDVEGVALKRKRPGIREFRVDDYGAPTYPELVLTATRRTVERRPGIVRATVHALERGYAVTIHHPARSAHDLVAANPGLDPGLIRAELRALHGAFTLPGEPYGALDRHRLRAWARWEKRFGIVRRRPDVERMFDPGFL